MGYKCEQFVEKVDENLICSICHEVLRDPYGCKDGHSFCNDCITEWLRTRQTCPMDNNKVLEADNLMRNLIPHNMVQNLKVWCHPPENDEGAAAVDLKTKGPEKSHLRGQRPNNKYVPVLEKKCEWKGKLQSLVKHRETCLFQQVQCPNENCTETLQRRELEEHNKKCEYRKLECNKCRKVLARNDIQKHTADECPETLIPCPSKCTKQRQGQIQQIKRVDLDNHLKNICPKTILDCPFKDQGCSIQVERQHVDKHVQDNMAAHMMLLARKCSSLTEENRLLQKELSHVKDNIADQASSAISSYAWTIKDFPTLSKDHPNGYAFTSPIFWLRGHRYSFVIYPNGVKKKEEEWLSLYLHLSEVYTEMSCRVISKINNNETTVKYRLSMKSIKPDTDDVSRELTHVFKEPGSWGWPKFMKTTDALSAAYCSSSNGNLTIQCIILPDEPQ